MTPGPDVVELPDLGKPGGDLEFLLGVLFNQQIRAEVAWKAPARLAQRLGSLDVHALAAAAPRPLTEVMRRRPAVHPFAAVMATHVIGICQLLTAEYGARACNLWADRPSPKTLRHRLTAMPGIGRHKASVAITFLACEYGVPLDGRPTEVQDVTREALSACPRLGEVFVT